MSDRTIESVYDIDEDDVEAVHHVLELTRGLIDFNDDRDDYRKPFSAGRLVQLENDLNGLWQSLAVVVASQQNIDPTDLMEDTAHE